MNNSNSCPCGRSIPYQKCCGSILQDIKRAITAEDLMRSRYTAYTKADGDFLMKSHFSKTRPIKDKKDIVRWSKSVKWLRLEVLNQTKGQNEDQTGTVEFKAYFMDDGEIDVIHENSDFLRENGYWVYVDMVSTH